MVYVGHAIEELILLLEKKFKKKNHIKFVLDVKKKYLFFYHIEIHEYYVMNVNWKERLRHLKKILLLIKG